MNYEFLYAASPEIFLSVAAMALLVFGVIRGERSAQPTSFIALVILLITGVIVIHMQSFLDPGVEKYHIKSTWYGRDAFNHMYINDAFGQFVKLIILAGGALSLMLSWSWLMAKGLHKPEYPVLLLLSTVGMMVMVSANDMLSLYVGLELQSLALYVMAAFHRDDAKSSEAGLKYFVLGALASGLILYGISLIYGYAGTTSFDALSKLAFSPAAACDSGAVCPTSVPLGVIFGLVFVAAALAFKVSAVPFHMWTPDVYEGAPTPVTAFFSAAPKVAGIALFTRVLIVPLVHLEPQWQQIIVFIALASMILGSFAGLVQTNIKRLLAYSSIANVGYALLGLAANSVDGIQGLLIYLAIYFLNSLGVFAIVLCMRRNNEPAEKIDDLAGLSKRNPVLAMAMTVFMFSLAGVPPLAGFFGKYFVFLAAVKAGGGLIPIAVLGVLTSVVAAAYYLRIIKLMYFDEPTAAIDPVPEFGLRFAVGITALTMLLFVLYPAPLIDAALTAARSIFISG